MIGALDRLLAALVSAGRWLVVPVVVLLFAQWPLREVAKAGSREANDLGQWLFALLVSLSFVAATRAGIHLTPGGIAGSYSERVRLRLELCLQVAVLAPWAALVIVAAWPTMRASLFALERFPETGNPGYFVVKLAAVLLAGTVLLQAVVAASRAARG